MTFTIAATFPPLPCAVKLYSPLPRQFAAATLQSLVWSVVATPLTNRGSYAHAPPAGTGAGAVNVWIAPPEVSGVNARLGVSGPALRFWTTIVDTRPPFAFFTAYAPYAVPAPVEMPFAL